MTDRKACIRCGRNIDQWSKLCPFCNWDQSEAPPPPSATPAQPLGATKVRSTDRTWWESVLLRLGVSDNPWRLRLFAALAATSLLITAFALGMIINRDATPKVESEPPAGVAVQGKSRLRANVPLVPVADIEQPITSAPPTAVAEGMPAEYQRSDATAVSSEEYMQLAARARAEKKIAGLVDPRTLTGPAYVAPKRPRPATPASDIPSNISVRTRPVPQYQPLPQIRVSHRMTARFDLIIGADGSVKEVRMREGIPGETGRLIHALQAWKFKPATQNGVPVAAPFSVDISFNGNE